MNEYDDGNAFDGILAGCLLGLLMFWIPAIVWWVWG